ncbi:MAG: hypothetical protein JNK91_07410 [Ferruginibacter sp.]|nr:hypothetical protein [Ferruginibacter sp.]
MDNKFVIIIVNSIPPYCYELNNILSLPDNFSYRFRYQKTKQGNWMPEIQNPYDLKKKHGLIVLRDFQTTAEFIPIRKIFIDNILVIGDIVYIEYLLKEKVELSSDLTERDNQINQFNQRIVTDINLTKYPNTPLTDLKNLIFFGTDYSYDIQDNKYKGANEDKDSNKWGNIIETIGKYKGVGLPVYNNNDFFKIIGIADENGVFAKQKIKNSKAYYEIDNKKIYKIQFLQRTYTGRSNVGDSSVLTPRIVELATGNPEIIPIISQKDIMGKYDLLELTFKSNVTSPTLQSFLLLRVIDSEPPKAPTIIIPIKVLFSKREFFLNISSVLFFVLLFITYLYAEGLMKFLNPNNTNLASDVNSLKNILLPLMIIFGSNTFKRITSIKEFIFGRINL